MGARNSVTAEQLRALQESFAKLPGAQSALRLKKPTYFLPENLYASGEVVQEYFGVLEITSMHPNSATDAGVHQSLSRILDRYTRQIQIHQNRLYFSVCESFRYSNSDQLRLVRPLVRELEDIAELRICVKKVLATTVTDADTGEIGIDFSMLPELTEAIEAMDGDQLRVLVPVEAYWVQPVAWVLRRLFRRDDHRKSFSD